MSELVWHQCPKCPEFYLTSQPLAVHIKAKHPVKRGRPTKQ
jgi:hypothetical protein